jgi:hypothetical protein
MRSSYRATDEQQAQVATIGGEAPTIAQRLDAGQFDCSIAGRCTVSW